MQDAIQVILGMRHAEKPEDVEDPNLAPAGQVRAQALAEYIPEHFFTPDFIFCAAISKHSARPFETVQPLSMRTGTPIDSTTADQDYAFLAREIRSDARYAGKHIVVCWHHGNIPSLIRALGGCGGNVPRPLGSYSLQFDLEAGILESITCNCGSDGAILGRVHAKERVSPHGRRSQP